LERATTWIGRILGDLDERLAAHRWLAGDAFSLADLAWSIDIHRFELIKFPMERFTAMREWYRRIESRPGFQRMVLDYEGQFGKSMEAAEDRRQIVNRAAKHLLLRVIWAFPFLPRNELARAIP
jgi:glutathione S-transferase